jgi:hypothetical protein
VAWVASTASLGLRLLLGVGGSGILDAAHPSLQLSEVALDGFRNSRHGNNACVVGCKGCPCGIRTCATPRSLVLRSGSLSGDGTCIYRSPLRNARLPGKSACSGRRRLLIAEHHLRQRKRRAAANQHQGHAKGGCLRSQAVT